MANTCSTNFIIKGTSKVIDFLFEKIDNCNAGRYPNEGDTPHIVDIFGADAELFIDKIGSKWISIQDYFTNSDTEMEVHFESAWYPPSDMLKEIHRQLIEIDSDVTFTARYWDEGYEPIGVIKITKDGEYITRELDDLSVDDEPEFFWDDVIAPSFEQLEQLLNIK